ncbi:unnamed protein product, partial [marine sediment metagenome]
MAQQTVYVAPGEYKVISFEVVPTEARTYSVSMDGVDISFTAAVAPITGEIVAVRMYYEGADWETVWALPGVPGVIPGKIPLNSEIYLTPTWENTSIVDIVGHVELKVTYPDGTERTLSAASGQDSKRSPGGQAN